MKVTGAYVKRIGGVEKFFKILEMLRNEVYKGEILTAWVELRVAFLVGLVTLDGMIYFSMSQTERSLKRHTWMEIVPDEDRAVLLARMKDVEVKELAAGRVKHELQHQPRQPGWKKRKRKSSLCKPLHSWLKWYLQRWPMS